MHPHPSSSSSDSRRVVAPGRLPRHLQTLLPGQFLLRCLAAAACALGCVIWIASVPGVLQLLGQIALGLVLAHGTELAHQCLHRTGTGRTELDHLIGRALTLPTGVSFFYYLYFHFWHHKHNGTDQDAESFGYAYEAMSSASRVRRVLGFLRHLSMVDHYVATGQRIVLAVLGRLTEQLTLNSPMPAAMAKRVQMDYQIIAVMAGGALVGGLLMRSWLPVTCWLVPVVISWGPAHALIELPEHFATPRPDSDPLRNTRSIRAGAIARYYTNANCDHVEHHSYPHVAMQRLPAVREAMAGQGLVPHYADQNYPQFFGSLLRHLRSGPSYANDGGAVPAARS